MTDLIVEEIRRLRDEYAKRFNYDIGAMFADLKKKEQASGRKVVSLSPKRAKTRKGKTRKK